MGLEILFLEHETFDLRIGVLGNPEIRILASCYQSIEQTAINMPYRYSTHPICIPNKKSCHTILLSKKFLRIILQEKHENQVVVTFIGIKSFLYLLQTILF